MSRYQGWSCGARVCFLSWLAMACGSEGGGGSATVHTILKSSDLALGSSSDSLSQANGTALNDASVTLTNMTGQADSLLVLTTEDYCGFSAWTAFNQSGPVGTEGRTYEAFDLGDPTEWTSAGTGLRDGCNGGGIIEVSAYFATVDLHLSVPSSLLDGAVVVRVAMGDVAPYLAGDVLVQDSDGAFAWVDVSTDALVPETSERPSTAYQMAGIKNFAAFEDGGDSGGRLTVLQEVKITIADESEDVLITRNTNGAVIDVDMSDAEITASDTASLSQLVQTLSVPFIENVRGQLSPLIATVTLTEAAAATETDTGADTDTDTDTDTDAQNP